jgi:hypothetical protein
MSKERELLYRWYRGARDQVDFGELYDKTEELLAKPERGPLTPQQISEGNQSMLNATRETFIAGVRFAEVMHGITGVDDE